MAVHIPTVAVPYQAPRRDGSLPSTALRPGSPPEIRGPWHNSNPSSDLRTPRSARQGGIPLHNDPDVRRTPLDRQRHPPRGGQIPPSGKRLDPQTE